MTYTSMIERVARAACEAGHHQWPETDSYNDRAEKRAWMKVARAAIEAMKTPTFEMVEAPAGLEIDPGTADDVWQSMIDKALEN